jgi:two-component system heavy metal sensor histidine kinase CusS
VLEQLDRSIISRASLLISEGRTGTLRPLPADDRFIVKNEHGQTIARPDSLHETTEPVVLSRAFTVSAEGKPQRTLSLRFASSTGEPLTIVYSGSAEEYNRMQKRLLWTISLTIAIGLPLTFFIARWMSRIVTRPLINTAQTIGEVDEWNLNRRIDVGQLPDELKPVGERLNTMLGRLEEAFGRQRQFLADSAHELRTPVAALRTGIEVALHRERTAPELKEVLQRSLTSIERLSDLVQDLLSIAKSGAQSPEALVKVDVTRMLHDRIHELQSLADKKGVTLAGEISIDSLALPLPVRAFSTIITNLLENALRHTDRGGKVKLLASCPDQLLIEVTDDGCGIAAEHLPRIFEPFYQSDASRKNASGNLGLGLYLVRLNVLRMGGRISCRSEVGKGTSFLIELPVSPPTSDNPA